MCALVCSILRGRSCFRRLVVEGFFCYVCYAVMQWVGGRFHRVSVSIRFSRVFFFGSSVAWW